MTEGTERSRQAARAMEAPAAMAADGLQTVRNLTGRQAESFLPFPRVTGSQEKILIRKQENRSRPGIPAGSASILRRKTCARLFRSRCRSLPKTQSSRLTGLLWISGISTSRKRTHWKCALWEKSTMISAATAWSFMILPLHPAGTPSRRK